MSETVVEGDSVQERIARAHLAHGAGAIVLHGSAVALSSSLCILGPSTAGKSTVAAFLVERGFGLLSEGMVVVALEARVPVAQPGPQVFRLWPEAIQRLGCDPASFAAVATNNGKRSVPAARVVPAPTRISSIYVLSDAPRAGLEQLRGADAAVALLKNLYLEGLLDLPQLGAALDRCARIADSTRVFRLSRRKHPDTLSTVVDMIANDSKE